MEKWYLIREAKEFLDRTKYTPWTPQNFPEDMEDDDLLYTLIDEGNELYDEFLRAQELISLLLDEIS